MNGDASKIPELDPANDDIFVNGRVIVASAGTGKTYSVAALVTRAIAEDDSLRISNVLITTYTRNAAAELKDRIRRRLADTAAALALPAGERDPHDRILARLAAGSPEEVAQRIDRLERGCVEFDSATIGTIHSICHRVLKAAGQETAEPGDDDHTDRIVDEVANDFVVNEAAQDRIWDEATIAALIHALLGDPNIAPWFSATAYPDEAERRRLEQLRQGLVKCVGRVHGLMRTTPSFNDLLRRARDIVVDRGHAALVARLKSRFRLAIIDEAQDTDSLQWQFFRALFPPVDPPDGRALVAVGDPKQSIYGFRGADVRAFVDYEASCVAANRRTLRTNRRSDQPVLDGLNAAFATADFGSGIGYLEVRATADRQESQLSGGAPVEFIDVGAITNQNDLAPIVARKVIDILDNGRLGPPPGRRVKPGEVCVLVRKSEVGRRIHQALPAGIRAVTGGTSSVMRSDVARQFRTLLEALDQPANLGRIRRAAATPFFGLSLRDAGLLGDDVLLGVQERVASLAQALRRSGIAAVGAMLAGNEEVMSRIGAGEAGERNITDFSHVVETMHVRGSRRGCTPREALELFAELERTDEMSDTVSRRVESDADAVKILTIHKAKGLEFPCVIVADLWKHTDEGTARKRPAVFYDRNERGEFERRLDIGFALRGNSPAAIALVMQAQDEEARRLLYVATTRPEHHVSVLVAGGDDPSILQESLSLPALLPAAGLPTEKQPEPPAKPPTLVVAPAATIVRTYQRLSYSGLVGLRSRRGGDAFAPQEGGSDEEPTRSEAEARDFRIPELPGGTAAGRVIHKIYEHVDATKSPLAEEVRRVVVERATSGLLAPHHDSLVQIVTESLQTPWGGPFGDVSFSMIGPSDRMVEAGFEMSLASLTDGVKARHIGAVLERALATRSDDPLLPYARMLDSSAFDIPVGGLLTGSIDCLLRLPGSTDSAPRLAIGDYKSNKLHATGAASPLDAYDHEVILEEMFEHHYPLQALIYGTAVFRWLRWRLPGADPDECIRGIVYAFIRGMKGPSTPTDSAGRRRGVFTWQAPPGLWKSISDLLAGKEAAA